MKYRVVHVVFQKPVLLSVGDPQPVRELDAGGISRHPLDTEVEQAPEMWFEGAYIRVGTRRFPMTVVESFDLERDQPE